MEKKGQKMEFEEARPKEGEKRGLRRQFGNSGINYKSVI